MLPKLFEHGGALIVAIVAFALVVIACGPKMAHDLKDVALKVSRALANGAAAVTSSALDTGKTTALGVQPGNVELLLSAPAMNATEMPDAKTMIYDVIHSDNSDLSSPSTLHDNAITQTGAGGVGCAAATKRIRLPSDAKRYIGFTATGSAAGNATTATATLELQA